MKLALLISVMLGAAGAVGGEPLWPVFLGPQPRPTTTLNLPLRWSPQENLAWYTPLQGQGQSSPVVWGERVFVTSVIGGEPGQIGITCVGLDDGTVSWNYFASATKPIRVADHVAHAAVTPVVDSNRVFAMFETGQILCLNHDGQVQWQHDVATHSGTLNNRYGLAASLTQDEANLFAAVDHEGPSCLLALNKATGQPVWRAERPAGSSWGSPVLLDIAGVPQIVISAKGMVVSYAAHTGNPLWLVSNLSGNEGPTICDAGQGRLLIGACVDGHGMTGHQAMRSNLAIDLRREGADWDVKPAWFAHGALASFASPIAHRGYGYWIDHRGRITCVALDSGEAAYSERLPEPCWATPIGDGDRVYFFGMTGNTTVVRAGGQFEVLATNDLSEAAFAAKSVLQSQGVGAPTNGDTGTVKATSPLASSVHPWGVAAVQGAILLRSEGGLTCIR